MEYQFYPRVGGIQVREDKDMPEYAIYQGGCDKVRLSNYKWARYEEGELIVGKTYKIETYAATQTDEYLWLWVVNEHGQRCQYYTGYFEPTDFKKIQRKIRKMKLESIWK